VKTVCGICNNGWMSDLEADNIPVIGSMMQDIAIPLDEAQQKLVAAWSVKTAMVSDSMKGRAAPNQFYTRDECINMRLKREIPARTLIWISRIDGMHRRFRNRFRAIRSPKRAHRNGFSIHHRCRSFRHASCDGSLRKGELRDFSSLMQDGKLERFSYPDLADTKASRAMAAESVVYQWGPAGHCPPDGQMEDGRGSGESYSVSAKGVAHRPRTIKEIQEIRGQMERSPVFAHRSWTSGGYLFLRVFAFQYGVPGGAIGGTFRT
jgi:hypothetical protein